MHAADPEPPPGIDCAVIQPHAGAIIHQGERAQGLGLEIVGCNLAPGGNDEIAGTRTLTLTLPSGTDTGTLKIVLNVTSRFSATSCNGGVCEQGTLSSADGLRDDLQL